MFKCVSKRGGGEYGRDGKGRQLHVGVEGWSERRQ